MPGEHLSLSKSSLAYAKLAATPTETAWSQVYNAGNLFACLSLTITTSSEEQASLQNLGKELLSNLEAEFFTLEEKTPETISEAIKSSTKHIPENVSVNFSLAYFKEHILYIFLLGPGRVIMKREEKLGVLLEKKETDDASLQTASGYLQNGDIIILETNQFAKNISEKHITEALQLSLPNDIAESLSMHMHKQTDGDQAAIIIVYHGLTHQAITTHKTEPTDEDSPETNEEILEDEIDQQEDNTSKPPLFSKFSLLLKNIRIPLPYQKRRIVMGGLTHRKKFFLSISFVILLLLIVSVVFTKQKQETSKNTALFESIYTPASKYFDEGKALVSLNESLSHEDFQKAEKLLLDGRSQFAKDSEESKKIEELLAKVQSELGPGTDSTNASPVKEVTVADTNMLALEKATNEGRGFTQNDTLVYYVTADDAVSVSKKTNKKTTLVENDEYWQQAVAIVPYQTNFYVLDQKDGVLKFVPSGSTYSKNAYFKSASPDLTKAVSMAIDSSIWILLSDGVIKKYTRGEADTFSLKGLTKPLSNPTKIYTNPDINNIYILDNGNSRIVKIGNDGTFQEEYKAGIIKSAKDFEVLESDKKINILSGDKIWELAM